MASLSINIPAAPLSSRALNSIMICGTCLIMNNEQTERQLKRRCNKFNINILCRNSKTVHVKLFLNRLDTHVTKSAIGDHFNMPLLDYVKMKC